MYLLFLLQNWFLWSRDDAVGIVTRYGLEGPGFEPSCGDIFRTRPERPRGLASLLYNEYPVSSQAAGRPERGATTHPFLAPGSRWGRAIPMPPLCTRQASNGTADLCKYKLELCLQCRPFYTKETPCQQFCTELAVYLTILYKLRGLSPRTNYTDRAAAVGRRS